MTRPIFIRLPTRSGRMAYTVRLGHSFEYDDYSEVPTTLIRSKAEVDVAKERKASALPRILLSPSFFSRRQRCRRPASPSLLRRHSCRRTTLSSTSWCTSGG